MRKALENYRGTDENIFNRPILLYSMKDIWKGWIIEESLKDLEILPKLNIINSKIEENNSGDEKKIWKLDIVEVGDNDIDKISKILENKIKLEYYIHFTNKRKLLIIFHKKSFVMNLENCGEDDGNGVVYFKVKSDDKKLWKEAFNYGTGEGKVDKRYLIEVE